MKKFLVIGCLLLGFAGGAAAGSITGTVRAEGKPTPGGDEAGGKYDSHKFKFAEKVNYEALRDFVVYIEGPLRQPSVVPEQPLQIVMTNKVTQHGAQFSPHVLPVVAGTTVEWPNKDEIYHNVFSYSETKPFDLQLYKAPEVKRVTFDKAGRVDVFCSIHTSMSCVVLVLDNSFFAATDAGGHYAITNVPAGVYTVKAWHERLPLQTRKVVVPDVGEAKADFVMSVKNLPQY